ncbi:MAG TPA: chemotaxis protein CheW [Candidatus Dormibacteraeota bacterium]|nr:chemotaxis protein CheW [Candidatus Dormibacteraeota bacterium]
MPQTAPLKPGFLREEQIILFRIGEQLFALSSSSVQEVRSAESLCGGATEIAAPGVDKVRQFVRRGNNTLFLVSGAAHFGLSVPDGILAFVLRNTRTALLVDSIERMTAMTRLQALPLSFCHEERQWYRGLTALDQIVVPVVCPEGFLSDNELVMLDRALPPPEVSSEEIEADTDSRTEVN